MMNTLRPSLAPVLGRALRRASAHGRPAPSPRRVDLLWQGAEISHQDKLKADAKDAGLEVPEFVKRILSKALGLSQPERNSR